MTRKSKTEQSLTKNLSKLTTTSKKKVKSVKSTPKPSRKTRIDKKPVFIDVKSDAKWELGNGNGNIKNTMPWYLHPVKKDHFNRSWFRDYEDTCKQIKRLKLRPEDYTLWHWTNQKSS